MRWSCHLVSSYRGRFSSAVGVGASNNKPKLSTDIKEKWQRNAEMLKNRYDVPFRINVVPFRLIVLRSMLTVVGVFFCVFGSFGRH